MILWFLHFTQKGVPRPLVFLREYWGFAHSADFLEISENHRFPLKSRNFMNFHVFAENHFSAWQCSPELSISPRSHETVQNIRRDLMYGGVGAADFHEFHSFSWNSLNSPKFHRISWFDLNFMKFMKMLKFQQKSTFSRPAAETSMIPKEFYRFARSTFTPKCKFPWKSLFLLKLMKIMKITINPRNHEISWFYRDFALLGHAGPPNTYGIP